MILLIIVPLAIFNQIPAKPRRREAAHERQGAARCSGVRAPSPAGLAGRLAMPFLYLPIVALVVYSFNDSPVPNLGAASR